MLKKYQISKVAKVIGMSDEGVRNYEKVGIIKPEIDNDTGYRHFDIMDIVTLFSSKMFRNLGFDLKETSKIINDYEVHDIKSVLLNKENYLKEKIKIDNLIIKRLENINFLVDELQNKLYKCCIAKRPSMYRLEFLENGGVRLSKEKQRFIQEWVKLSPLSALSTRYPLETFPDYADKSISGLGILYEDAKLIDIKENEFIKFWPETKCAYSLVRCDNSRLSIDFGFMFDYLCKYNLKHNGDVISRAIISTHQNREFNRYLQVWMPIE